MSLVTRICENKGADQLRSNCVADLHLCFRYIDSSIPLLPQSEISTSMIVQPGLCGTWLETPIKDRFSQDAAQLL